MKIRLKSVRFLKREAKYIRALTKKYSNEKVELVDILQTLSNILGFESHEQFLNQSDFPSIMEVIKLDVICKRELLIRSRDIIRSKYIGAFDYAGFTFLVDESGSDNILENVTALSVDDFCNISPPLGLEYVSKPIYFNGVMNHELVFKSFKSQLGSLFTENAKEHIKYAVSVLESYLDSDEIFDIRDKCRFGSNLIILSLYSAVKEKTHIDYKTELSFLKSKERVLWLAFDCMYSNNVYPECLYLVLSYRGILNAQVSVDLLEKNFIGKSSNIICDCKVYPDDYELQRKQNKIPQFHHWISKKAGISKNNSVSEDEVSRGVAVYGGAGSGCFSTALNYCYLPIRNGCGGLIFNADESSGVAFSLKSLMNSVGRQNDLIILSEDESQSNDYYLTLLRENTDKRQMKDFLRGILINNSLSKLTNEELDVTNLIVDFLFENKSSISFLDFNIAVSNNVFFDKLHSGDSYESIIFLKAVSFAIENNSNMEGVLKSYISKLNNYFEKFIKNSKNIFCNYNNLDFSDAIKNNRVILLNVGKNNPMQNLVINKYFKELETISYSSKNIEGNLNDLNPGYNIKPFIYLSNCYAMSPVCLKKKINSLRIKLGLFPIISIDSMSEWQKSVSGSVQDFWNSLGYILTCKTDDVEYLRSALGGLNIRDVTNMTPGMFVLNNSGDVHVSPFLNPHGEVLKLSKPIDISELKF